MQATDFLIRAARVEQSKLTGDVFYRGYTIKTWKVEGYGWVGEIRDAGTNLMPRWMNAHDGFTMRFGALDYMRTKIDHYLASFRDAAEAG